MFIVNRSYIEISFCSSFSQHNSSRAFIFNAPVGQRIKLSLSKYFLSANSGQARQLFRSEEFFRSPRKSAVRSPGLSPFRGSSLKENIFHLIPFKIRKIWFLPCVAHGVGIMTHRKQKSKKKLFSARLVGSTNFGKCDEFNAYIALQ